VTALTVVIGKGEPRVDSRILATGLRNQHKNVLELVERYVDKFRRFGVVPFQTEKPTRASGGRPERFALLNEDQSYFLLALSRNTDHVVELKASLVAAFKEARAGSAVAVEYLPGYHALHDRAHELAAGSANEKFVHMNLNKLVNKTAGADPGTRSRLAPAIKARVTVAQEIAIRAMESANDHHDGYDKAKQALSSFGQVLRLKN
jgi:phage regulator Rha-like protein